MTEERQFLRNEGFGLDLATVVHTNHLEKLLKKYKEKQLTIPVVVSSAKTKNTTNDKGWIYCPNCGRVKDS